MALDVCRRELKQVCRAQRVSNMSDLASTVAQVGQAARLAPVLQHTLEEISELIGAASVFEELSVANAVRPRNPACAGLSARVCLGVPWACAYRRLGFGLRVRRHAISNHHEHRTISAMPRSMSTW